MKERKKEREKERKEERKKERKERKKLQNLNISSALYRPLSWYRHSPTFHCDGKEVLFMNIYTKDVSETLAILYRNNLSHILTIMPHKTSRILL